MTDSKITKALECCIDCNCKNCPCQTEDGHCLGIDEALILDLINRQKAEIERLKTSPIIGTLCPMWKNEARAEAIREFAERLKKSILSQLGISTLEKTEAYHFCLDELDNIVKEMTEVLDECN